MGLRRNKTDFTHCNFNKIRDGDDGMVKVVCKEVAMSDHFGCLVYIINREKRFTIM